MERMRKMVKIYLRKIRGGTMTVEQVPERWREQVREQLGKG